MDPIFGFPTDPEETEGYQATAGEPLTEGTRVADDDQVIAALREVYDPEIPVNLYDLGLIYDITIEDSGNVSVLMTLTTPACPVAAEMPQQVADAVSTVPGTGTVTVTLTWEPPWTMEKMSDDAKLALGLG